MNIRKMRYIFPRLPKYLGLELLGKSLDMQCVDSSCLLSVKKLAFGLADCCVDRCEEIKKLE